MAEPITPTFAQGSAADPAPGPREHLALGDRTLREHTTQGVLINGTFQVGLAFLGVSRHFLIAIFLTAADYGLWGLIYTAFAAVMFFKDIGIGDKYVQQTETDQEAAFQKAFTLELAWSAAFVLLVLIGIPIFSLIYGYPEMVLPGWVLAIAVLAGPFTASTWVFYREMRFVRQRTLLAIEPIVGFVVTVGLGIADFGYWSIVIGAVAGTWAAAIACIAVSPYRMRLRYERGTLREYYSFSWPLLLATGSGVLTIQLAVFLGQATVGLAGVGAIGLAGVIVAFADRADVVVTQTLYPAICAVRDDVDKLRESFAKSNRLALVWSIPFCIGLTLFADDLVTYVLGEKWDDAILLLQAFGLACVLKQVAFSWTAYHRAVGETRPMAVNGFVGLVTFTVVAIPAMTTWGLPGYAMAIAAMSVAQLVVRAHYLSNLLGGFDIGRHSIRAVVPCLPAVAAVLGVRLIETGDRTAGMALGELVLFTAVVALATWLLERDLVREATSYLRPRAAGAA